MYHVMIILTDGIINDMQATTKLIVQLSKFPVSLIIIGVGNADFTEMKTLDGDDKGPLRDQNNQKSERDIVQFVKF